MKYFSKSNKIIYSKYIVVLLIGIWTLILLLASCKIEGNTNSEPNKGNANSKPDSSTTSEGKLTLNKVKGTSNEYSFKPFDDPLKNAKETSISIEGATFYGGELSTHDNIRVPVFAALTPKAKIDRILIQINGGTGVDPRYFLKNLNHKASVIISMRGLHHDFIQDYECALGGELINCIKALPTSVLKPINSKDNGKDIVTLMQIILGNTGTLIVDDQIQDHSFFGATDTVFNVDTGSFGATLLAYALAEEELPKIGRIYIDGPSAPDEMVISDGFRNTKVVIENFMDVLTMNEQEKSTFLEILKSRHSAPNQSCDSENPLQATFDCVSSAMIFIYMKNEYEDISSMKNGISAALSTLKTKLLSIPTTEATAQNDLNVVQSIYASDHLTKQDRKKTTWELSKLDLTSSNSAYNGFQSPGFLSRIALICTSYINRINGDSEEEFKIQKELAENNPYWYGFLIDYREMYKICLEIDSKITSGIKIPSGVKIDIEALVQYGAGLDEKHHQKDMETMATYINDNNLKKKVYIKQHVQGGSGIKNKECEYDLRLATFSSQLDDLNNLLNTVITTNCT